MDKGGVVDDVYGYITTKAIVECSSGADLLVDKLAVDGKASVTEEECAEPPDDLAKWSGNAGVTVENARVKGNVELSVNLPILGKRSASGDLNGGATLGGMLTAQDQSLALTVVLGAITVNGCVEGLPFTDEAICMDPKVVHNGGSGTTPPFNVLPGNLLKFKNQWVLLMRILVLFAFFVMAGEAVANESSGVKISLSKPVMKDSSIEKNILVKVDEFNPKIRMNYSWPKNNIDKFSAETPVRAVEFYTAGLVYKDISLLRKISDEKRRQYYIKENEEKMREKFNQTEELIKLVELRATHFFSVGEKFFLRVEYYDPANPDSLPYVLYHSLVNDNGYWLNSDFSRDKVKSAIMLNFPVERPSPEVNQKAVVTINLPDKLTPDILFSEDYFIQYGR